MKRDVTVICGSMFSGKTTKLMELYVADNCNKLLIKHSLDNKRGGEGVVKTHDGRTILGARSLNSLKTVLGYIDEFNSIYIDEAQFFDVIEMQWLVSVCIKQNKKLVLAGLLRDRNNKPFVTMKDLLLYRCSDAVFLKAICECGNPATETLFTGNDGDDLIGGDDKYKATCLECWNAGMSELKR